MVLVYLAYQWQKWNKRGWHQVHFRAMLLYARLAGIEAARAQQEGNSFNKVDACRALALAMTGPGREAGIDVMINSLVEERGSYFAGILERYGAQAAPKLTPETIRSIAEQLRRFDFGPELVIGNIVENTFGGIEAARYVMAVATGEAS